MCEYNPLRRLKQKLFPLSSQLSGLDQAEMLKKLYIRATKYVTALSITVSLPLAILADKILYYWMGEEFAQKGGVVMTMLVLAYCLTSLNAVPFCFFYGLNRPKTNAFFSLLSGVGNTVLWLILVPRLGLTGAAMGFLLGRYTIPIFLYCSWRLLDISAKEILINVYSRLVLVSVLSSLIIKVVLSRHIVNLISLLGALIVSVLLFPTLLVAMGFFDAEDRGLAKGYVSSIIKAANQG